MTTTTTLEQVLPQITRTAKMFAAGDTHVADDIASEAISYILEKGYQNEKPAFIMQAVRWIALGHIDSGKTYSKYVGDLESIEGSEDEDGETMDALELIADPTANPEDMVADMEFAAEFSAAVENLDQKAQVIIRLLGEGLSFSEIANELGVSRSAISQKMNTIQKALLSVL